MENLTFGINLSQRNICRLFDIDKEQCEYYESSTFTLFKNRFGYRCLVEKKHIGSFITFIQHKMKAKKCPAKNNKGYIITTKNKKEYRETLKKVGFELNTETKKLEMRKFFIRTYEEWEDECRTLYRKGDFEALRIKLYAMISVFANDEEKIVKIMNNLVDLNKLLCQKKKNEMRKNK